MANTLGWAHTKTHAHHQHTHTRYTHTPSLAPLTFTPRKRTQSSHKSQPRNRGSRGRNQRRKGEKRTGERERDWRKRAVMAAGRRWCDGRKNTAGRRRKREVETWGEQRHEGEKNRGREIGCEREREGAERLSQREIWERFERERVTERERRWERYRWEIDVFR